MVLISADSDTVSTFQVSLKNFWMEKIQKKILQYTYALQVHTNWQLLK